MSTDSAPKFELEIDGLKKEQLSFLAFRADERLSDCYRIDVDALIGHIDPSSLLGKKATLYVRFEGSAERTFGGVIWSAELTPLDAKVNQLHVQIVPRLFKLSLGKSSKLYRATTILKLITKLLKDGGLPDDSLDFFVKEGPEHPMIVQREESDYDFIRRLLFEDGIGFLIQNDLDQERVVFFEDDSALIAVEGIDSLVDRRRKDMRSDTVFELRERFEITPDGVMLREYDAANPAQSPHAEDAAQDPPTRELYLHPGGHLVLDTRATRMRERVSMNARTFEGSSYWPHLEPGRHLQLESDLRASMNTDLLLCTVRHEGHIHDPRSKAAYQNSWTAIPKKTPYRPQTAPNVPVVLGTQRAFVTGPQSQELHGDELGRTTVRFPWDRDAPNTDKSSNFVRIGQLPLSGSMVVPRVGFEVVLGTELGDLDRPYITGHMYNEESGPPYGSANLTTSSMQTNTTDGGPGANELRFDDTAGSEQMLMNASYDLTLKVENTSTINVAKSTKIDVGGNAKLSVTKDHIETVNGQRKLDIGQMQTFDVGGDYNDGVGGNQTLTIGAAHDVTVSGDEIESVTGTLSRTISALQSIFVVEGFTRKIGGNSQVQVGAAWAETIAKSKSTKVSGGLSETVAALKMISAKTVGITTDAAYSEKVASEIVKTKADRTDKAGSDLKMKAGGGMSIQAKDITFTAEDQLTFSAGNVTITLKKTGEIAIKAKEITIKNSKALVQITHKTN